MMRKFGPILQIGGFRSTGINFTTYFFFRDKMPIDMNMLVFFLGKCVRTAAYCELERCADRVRSRTYNKDEVLEGKFRN